MDEPTNRPSNPMRFFEGATGSPAELPKEVAAYRDKLIARDSRAHEWLNSMDAKNPVRMIGEHIYGQVQRRDTQRLGRMLRTSSGDRSRKREPDRER